MDFQWKKSKTDFLWNICGDRETATLRVHTNTPSFLQWKRRKQEKGRVSQPDPGLLMMYSLLSDQGRERLPQKNLLVTASQKSWSWDKADVCPLLRTALGIINYRDLRDFINNFRHTDTKITFVFLSKGLGFLRVKILLTVTGKERQTVQSEAQLKVQAAACSGPKELIPCWHGKMYHGASCLKTSSLFSLHSMANKPMINVNIQPELSGASQWWQENLCHARLSA